MKRIVLLFVLLAVALLVAASLILFSDGGASDDALPLERELPPSKESPPAAIIDIPNDSKISPSSSKERKVSVEKLKPQSKWNWTPVDVVLRVLEHPARKPVPVDKVSIRVSQNSVPVGLTPVPTGRDGEVSFEDLAPAEYRFEAVTERGMCGRLTLQVEPAATGYRETLFVGSPLPIEIKVSRAGTSRPVAGAIVDLPDGVKNGLTNSKGIFRSKRLFTPDPSLAGTVSKAGFYTTFFHPFPSGKPRRKAVIPVKLVPLAGSCRLAGTIVDSDANPLRGWFLRLTSLGPEGSHCIEGGTDNNGGFVFEKITPGSYSLEGVVRTWARPGSSTFPALVNEFIRIPKGGLPEDIEIVCHFPRIRLRGIVLRADRMEPVAGVRVACNAYHGSDCGTYDQFHFDDVTTDGKGIFTLPEAFLPTEINILLQRTGLRLTPPRGEDEVYRLQPTPQTMNMLLENLLTGKPIRIWLRLRDDFELAGYVLDTQGNPLKGISIEAAPLAGIDRKRYRAISNPNGYFLIRNIFAGKWGLRAEFPGGLAVNEVLDITEESHRSLEIRALGNCRLEGIVKLGRARFYPKISVRGEGYSIDGARLNRNGRFLFEHLPAGRAMISVESYSGHRFEEQSLVIIKKEVDLVEGATVSIEL